MDRTFHTFHTLWCAPGQLGLLSIAPCLHALQVLQDLALFVNPSAVPANTQPTYLRLLGQQVCMHAPMQLMRPMQLTRSMHPLRPCASAQ